MSNYFVSVEDILQFLGLSVQRGQSAHFAFGLRYFTSWALVLFLRRSSFCHSLMLCFVLCLGFQFLFLQLLSKIVLGTKQRHNNYNIFFTKTTHQQEEKIILLKKKEREKMCMPILRHALYHPVLFTLLHSVTTISSRMLYEFVTDEG